MAKIMSVERVQTLTNNIDIYTKNKLGQYSKFLEKNPIFVTYYHINHAMSRADVGTGTVEAELGERSPIRFNKIRNFPVYNIPELKPDLVYDESGYDIELEVSDVVILPNTIKPRAGDFFLVSFPGIKEYLFRVTNIKYNTIQSNDFYTIDADIYKIGLNIESTDIEKQIVETYLTVFENIGTQDRCFVKSTDIDYINSLAELYYKLRDFYKNAFYNRNLNCFTYGTGRWSETGREIYRYDPFLEAFINRSNIYYDDNSENALVMTPADVLDSDFEFRFDFTLYNAILEHSLDLLKPYCYIVTNIITKRYSVFNLHHIFAESANLFCFDSERTNTTGVSSLNGGSIFGCATCAVPQTPSSTEVWYDLNPIPKCTPTWTLDDAHEYFRSEFLKMILCGRIDTNDYCELIIFNYLHNIKMKIDRRVILKHIDKNPHTYIFLPMIIYIIGTMYKDYFVSEQEIDL